MYLKSMVWWSPLALGTTTTVFFARICFYKNAYLNCKVWTNCAFLSLLLDNVLLFQDIFIIRTSMLRWWN